MLDTKTEDGAVYTIPKQKIGNTILKSVALFTIAKKIGS